MSHLIILLINQLINDEAVIKTAPATLGLLNMSGLVLNKTGFVLNMTGFVLNMTGFVLYTTGFALSMTVFH